MQVHPLADRIVAKPVEAETKTTAGILLAKESQKRENVAVVQAVGKNVKEVKVGDRLIHDGRNFEIFKQDETELIIIKEEDVLALVKD